jgi:hypothetical protein
MAYLLTCVGGFAAGYVLAIHSWPAARALIASAEAEFASLKSRLAALEEKARDIFGSGG